MPATCRHSWHIAVQINKIGSLIHLIAQALSVDVNSAVLKIDRLMHNRQGQPIQHMVIWSVPQRSRMVMEVDADELNNFNTGRLLHEVKK